MREWAEQVAPGMPKTQPHGEERANGPRKARPDDRLRARLEP